MYYDNAITSVQLNSSDRFVLDGQRIVVNPGPVSYGADGIYHYTEVQNFSTIIPHGPLGNQTYFKVVKKDGIIYYYGDYDNRNAYLKSDDKIVQWYIVKPEEPIGSSGLTNYLSSVS